MAKQFGAFDTALKMRDVIHQIVDKRINSNRPMDREAVVVDFDPGTLTAEVQFAGDTTTVEARYSKYKQPRRKTMDDPDGLAPGDIVRVGGQSGDFYIRDITDGDILMADTTLLDPKVITSSGLEELLALVMPQPGDLRYTFRSVVKNGAVLPGNFVCLDGTDVTRDAPFDVAWAAIGSPNPVAGNMWTLPDCRDRAPFGAGTGDVGLLADDGATLANRGPFHEHAVLGGNHQHGINSTDHSGIGNAVYNETGSKRIVQTVNGTQGGSHAHGGQTDFEGSHNHTGTTGSGAGSTLKLGWIGVNWLLKL